MVSGTTTTSKEETCDGCENRTNDNDGRFLKLIRRTNPYSVLCVFGFGILFLVFGLVVNTFWRDVFTQQIAKKLPLSNNNDSQTTKLWLSQKIPQYLKVYMFNWTNPNETMNDTEIPNFAEVGPYVFRTRVFKDNVEWNNNFTVSYLQKRTWEFIPEKSNGTLNDTVISINVVAVALAYQLEHISSSFVVNHINAAINLNKVELIIRKSVQDQLFNGYNDGILGILESFGSFFNPGVVDLLHSYHDLFTNMKDILTFGFVPKSEDPSLTQQILDRLRKLDNIKDKFGWWYQKNDSETHHFNIHTGQNDINLLGDVHSWNFKDKCKDNQEVHGSLGDLWPMDSAKRDRVHLFVPDMCSSFDLINSGPTEVEGIEGVKFVGTTETMGPSAARKPGTYVDTDILTGIRNITSIVKAPIFISFPHFYQASEEYRSNISGMNPTKENHEFSLVLQKDAGVVLQGCGRIQINTMVKPSSKIDVLSNFPSTVLFPTIWFEQTGEIPPDVIHRLQFAFVIMPRVLAGIGLGGIIISILGLVSGFLLLIFLYKPKPHRAAIEYFNFLILRSKSIKITVRKPTKPKTSRNQVDDMKIELR